MKLHHKRTDYLRSFEGIFLLSILIGGFVYRLYFADLAYKYPVFDMDRYVGFARDIMRGRLVADCCDKTAGYPMFLAFIFRLFGNANYDAVRIVQVFFDIGTIVYIVKIAHELFGKTAGYISGILYAFNPFTASYTGLLLPEVLTIFLTCGWVYLATRKQLFTHPMLWLLYGIYIGVLVFVRKQMMIIILLATAWIMVASFRKIRRKIAFILTVVCGFFLVSTYSLYGNILTFHKLSITPPYQPTGQMYILFFATKPYSELVLMGQQFEPIYYAVSEPWHAAPLDAREEINKKYLELFVQKATSQFPLFLKLYIRNMFWIWDRDHLFYYADPWYPGDKTKTRITSWLYIGIAVYGLAVWLFTNRRGAIAQPLFIVTIVLVVITTFLFALFSSEVRHSLAAFGMLSLWGGYGVQRFGLILRKIKIG